MYVKLTSLLAAILLGVVSTSPQTHEAPDQTLGAIDRLPSIELPPDLDRVLRDYEAAWQERDAKALAALFAEDGFVLRPGHPPVRGRAGIERSYEGSGGALALRALHVSVEGSVGYIIGAFAGEPDHPDMGKFVLALTKDESGDWLIAADMDNANTRSR